MASPTQRTLAELRRRGWPCTVTEHWNPFAKIRQDAWGFCDVWVMDDLPGSLIVQCTSASHVADRVTKITTGRRAPLAVRWLQAGNRIQVWGWGLRGPRGKRKLWTLREQKVTLNDFATK